MKKINLILLTILASLSSYHTIAQVTQQDYDALVALYNATGGPNWNDTTGWNISAGPANLTSNWYGVTVSGGRVTQLRLASNNLNGHIPVEIGNLEHLQILFLEKNQLSGGLPEEIGQLINLTYFYAHRNQLTGPIPNSIGKLVNLEQLKLYENQMSGEIPGSIGHLSSLRVLHLNINYFSGQLPPEMGNLGNLQNLRLFMNNFTGDIPGEFVNLSSLEDLQIYRNNFTSLPNLSALNISNLQIYRNNLDFGDILPYLDLEAVGTFTYSPQYKVSQPQNQQVPTGSSHTISVDVGGAGNTYQWYKGGLAISGANATEYTFSSFSAEDEGTYYCEIDHPLVNMTLQSEDFVLSAGPARQDSLKISLPEGSTCSIPGSGALVPGADGSFYFTPESIPGTGALTIEDPSGNMANIQFDIDEEGNISNVQMEVDGQYIPMYQGFFTASGSELEVTEVAEICMYR